MNTNYSALYLKQTAAVAAQVDVSIIEAMADCLAQVRDRKGRVFFLGVGGGAAHCSHAVNDFRKLAGIEAYAPTDNVSELTARTNDEGWETVFASWLATSQANEKDAVFAMSVGGGDMARNVSPNLVKGLEEAKKRRLKILGIVGRDGGFTRQVGDFVLVIPTIDPALVTPHTESFQAVVWHCLVSHPKLALREGKWESLKK